MASIFNVTTTGTAPTVTLALQDSVTTLTDPTVANPIVLTHPETRDLGELYSADPRQIAGDALLGAALDAGEVTMTVAGVSITNSAALEKIGLGTTLSDQDNQTFSEVLSEGNTSGGNNAQMTGTDQLQFGGTLNHMENGGTGNFTFTTNKAFEFNNADSQIFLQNSGNLSLNKPSTSDSMTMTPGGGAIGYVGTGIGSSIDMKSALSGATKLWTMPNKTGTVALLSDIPAGTDPDYVRVIFVSKNGNDSNDGKHPDKAKLTVGAAVTAIAAESPQDFQKGIIHILDNGRYFPAATLAIPANVNLYGPNAAIRTLGEYDAITVTDNSTVILDELRVEDDGAFHGIRMIGGTGTECIARINHVTGLGEGSRFINEAAGHFICHTDFALLDGNQGTVFYSQSGAVGRMTASWRHMELIGNATGVNAAEGGQFNMMGGDITGTTGTAINIGDIVATGKVGNIQMTGGTAYSIAPAAALGLEISNIQAGTRTQSTNNGGLIITNEADRQVYSANFTLGAYPGFGSLVLDASGVTTNETATFQNASGTVAYLSDVPGALETKSGFRLTTSFTGTPLLSAFTFATPFADANYSVSIVGADARSWTVESQTAAGFTINSNSSTALTGDVSWTAIKHGETS